MDTIISHETEYLMRAKEQNKRTKLAPIRLQPCDKLGKRRPSGQRNAAASSDDEHKMRPTNDQVALTRLAYRT